MRWKMHPTVCPACHSGRRSRLKGSRHEEDGRFLHNMPCQDGFPGWDFGGCQVLLIALVRHSPYQHAAHPHASMEHNAFSILAHQVAAC